MLELQHVGVTSQMSKIPECYADCLPYLVDKASVYLRLYGSVFLHKAKSDLTLEQFITLDAIANTPNICQRDLAKIILKDRSNVTRILSILENKGYIERLISVKNNRPVKILKLKPNIRPRKHRIKSWPFLTMCCRRLIDWSAPKLAKWNSLKPASWRRQNPCWR